jgi:hypothetical protein
MATKKEIEKLLEDPKAREMLKNAGYKLSRSTDQLVAKTFKLPKDVIEEFYKVARERDLKIQEAIEMALVDWMKK